MPSLSRLSLPRNTLLTLSLLLQQLPTVLSVSLSDFSPTATNLTTGCNSVYTAQIPGCSPSDFEPSSSSSSTSTCSSSCISALVNTNSLVYNACAADPQNNVQLIGAFLSGKGIQDLCPNVVVTTLVAGNMLNTATTVTTTSSMGKVTATVTAAGDGSVIGVGSSAATFTSVVASSSMLGMGMTMGSQVMVGTSVLVVPSSLSGSTSDGIIVDTRTPSIPLSTRHTTSTVSTTTSTQKAVTTSLLPMSTASSIASGMSTTIATKTSTSAVSGTSASATSCSDADHGGSPFNYCSTNDAPAAIITYTTALVSIFGVGALLALI